MYEDVAEEQHEGRRGGDTEHSQQESPESARPHRGSGDAAPSAEKPAMKRLTVQEAAEEIRRLRRIVRDLREEVAAAAAKQEVEAEYQRAAEKTKAEAAAAAAAAAAAEAAWKERNEALNTRVQELEQKAVTAEKEAQEAQEQMRYMQATSLPITDARKLTYKALRKGRALQCLADLVTQNSFTNRLLREGFTALLTNAFGATHVTFRLQQQQRLAGGIGDARAAGAVAAATDQQLRLFRQEQLLLLAENERLTQQVKQLQEEMTTAAQFPSTPPGGIPRGPVPWRSQVTPRSPDASVSASAELPASSEPPFVATHWRRVTAARRRAAATAGAVSLPPDHVLSLELLPAAFRSARRRVLSWAFRKLYGYGLFAAEQLRFEAAEQRDRNARVGSRISLGLRFLHFAVRFCLQRRSRRALWKLLLHGRCVAIEKRSAAALAAVQAAAAAKQRRPASAQQEEQQQQVCPHCSRRGFFVPAGGGATAAGEATTGPFMRVPRPPPAAGEKKGGAGWLSYICQPYYYKTLPSMQRRNIYFAAPPPPLQQENLRVQAMRQLGGVPEPVLRPEPGAAGVPARTFGAVEAETALSSGRLIPHALFDAELQQRNRALQGALLSQGTPSNNMPLSATQVNDMYIDMLLDEVNRSAPL